MKIVDNAKIAPHNLVRHALGGRAIGLAKAEALKDDLIKLYPGQRDLPIEADKRSAISRLRKADYFDGFANLGDMTASNIVFNALRDAELPASLRSKPLLCSITISTSSTNALTAAAPISAASRQGNQQLSGVAHWNPSAAASPPTARWDRSAPAPVQAGAGALTGARDSSCGVRGIS